MIMGINIVCSALTFIAVSVNGPLLRFGSQEVDLGAIPVDTIKKGEVWIHNDGDEPLLITQVFTDCGCTATEYVKDPIAPGDSSLMTVSFNSWHRSPGNFRKVVRVRSNANRKAFLLFVKGRVKRPLRK